MLNKHAGLLPCVDYRKARNFGLKAHPGPAVISGYENSIYDKHLRSWKKVRVKPPKVEKQAARMEVLWAKG